MLVLIGVRVQHFRAGQGGKRQRKKGIRCLITQMFRGCLLVGLFASSYRTLLIQVPSDELRWLLTADMAEMGGRGRGPFPRSTREVGLCWFEARLSCLCLLLIPCQQAMSTPIRVARILEQERIRASMSCMWATVGESTKVLTRLEITMISISRRLHLRLAVRSRDSQNAGVVRATVAERAKPPPQRLAKGPLPYLCRGTEHVVCM